jgi:hypothetical protein
MHHVRPQHTSFSDQVAATRNQTLSPLARPLQNPHGKGLTSLPYEVRGHVASYLDNRTAVSFSVTARALRLPAESQIWRQLSITPSDLVPPSPTRIPALSTPSATTNLHSTLLPADPDPAIAVQTPSLPTAIHGTTHTYPHFQHGQASAILLGRAVRRLIAHLKAAPWRGGMVRSLVLPLRHTVPSELIDLFHLTPGLNHLHITLPHTSMAIPNIPSYIPLEQVFASLPRTLMSLKTAKLALQVRPERVISNLLNCAPGLEHLHIFNRTPVRTPGNPADPRKSEEEQICDIPETRLKSLILDSTGTVIPLATEIVSHAASLEMVAVSDQTLNWKPISHDSLLTALAQLESLHTLELPCTAVPFLVQGFGNVKNLNIMWNAASLRHSDAKVGAFFRSRCDRNIQV